MQDVAITLNFSGCDWKYEIEAVLKLFFPATKFQFSFDAPVLEGNYCFVRCKVTQKGVWVFVAAAVNGKKKRRAQFINADMADGSKPLILLAGRMLYDVLSFITDVKPAWGTLTGVRPVKKIHQLVSLGLNKEQVFSQLKSDFLVEDSKLELAYSTAMVQKPLLKKMSDGFSLYVSIPFCPSRCHYCSFVSHSVESARELIPGYLEKLKEEIIYTADMARQMGLELKSIYIGGGTPTVLSAEELHGLMNTIDTAFDLSNCHVREYTVEAGRPDTITPDKLSVIKKWGANRLSINPQTFNDDVLAAIGRKHKSKDVITAFDMARGFGFDTINMDLIAGLPRDTPESFYDTLNQVIALKPENVTVHTLALKRAAKIYYENEQQLSHKYASTMTDAAFKNLSQAEYRPYYLYRQKNTLSNLENVGYALPGTESAYNVAIMEEIQTILAVGASGATKLVKDGKIQRIYNFKFPYEYIERFDLLLKKKGEAISFYKQGSK